MHGPFSRHVSGPSCRAGSDVRASVYEVIKKNDWGLLEFHRERNNLEKIFRDLTKEN